MIGHIHTVSALVIRRREPGALLVAIYAPARRHGGEDRHIFVFVDCMDLPVLIPHSDPRYRPAGPGFFSTFPPIEEIEDMPHWSYGAAASAQPGAHSRRWRDSVRSTC